MMQRVLMPLCLLCLCGLTQAQPMQPTQPKQQCSYFDQSLLWAIAQSPQQFLNDIRLQPVANDQTLSGYRITYLRDTSTLVEFKLQAGDVIQAINGIPIANANQIEDSVRQILDNHTFSLSVLRQEESLEMRYIHGAGNCGEYEVTP